MRKRSLWSLCVLLLTGCARLESIPYTPHQTPQSWLVIQPYLTIKFWSHEFILVQPSSTAFVYLLGLVTIAAGWHFFRVRNGQQSRKWWGIALLLWGFGALFAGTSYQAFSYEIKCAGRDLCSWTSWWEIVYLLFSTASIDAMLVAGAFSASGGKLRMGLIFYAVVNIILYAIIVLIGAFTLAKFLISFELLLIVAAPNILILLILNTWRYLKFRTRTDLALIGAWLWLGLTIGVYFLYYIMDVTHDLWQHGIWFSENDVLHIGLIIWMVYLAVFIAKQTSDQPSAAWEANDKLAIMR